jgi:hypothetical protein
VKERAQRARFWELLESKPIRAKGDCSSPGDDLLLKYIAEMKSVAELMIPKIEYLPGEALEKFRA